MKRKKVGKVVAVSLIVVLVAAIFGILKISSIDKYAGLVKVKNASLASISTKLKANISDLSEDNNIEVKGYDEIDYNISYRLSDVPGERDVIINAKIDERDIYASFKEVTGTDITSVLSSNRKEITITIKNLPANEQINSKVTLVIENAPKGYTVSPTVRIKESTSEDYTNIQVKPVTVNTTSVQGTVIDEEGNKVTNILVSLKKGQEVIKETYVNGDGIYTFSDIVPDTYTLTVNEENYEDLELNNLYIENGNVLNLIVKRVYPYKIETNKYITKVELNNIGSSKDYLYNDVVLANIPVKKVSNLHGKVYYKITVQNTGEKAGIISSVRDELPEGLSFDEELNSGYELKNGIIYNRNLEGVELAAGEMITDTLVLTIENTDIAKTYINKVSARGELYEHVVYLLNGKLYKTLDVLEGEVLEELHINNPDFSGWYTDEKLTNKYNFDLPVEKDLILYGVTAKKHKVTFKDRDPEPPHDEPIYDEQTVPNGEPAEEPNPDPNKTGYDFCGWEKTDGTKWDFNTPVTEDLTLISCYQIKSYTIEFYDNSINDGGEYELIGTLTKEYKSTLSNSETPDLTNAWEGHTFLEWTTDVQGQHTYDFSTQIKENKKLYAQYTLQDRLFIFNDENRITEKTVEYGNKVQAIADQGKEGHDFLYWSLTQPSSSEAKTPFDFDNTPIYSTTTVYAIYQIRNYPVVFNDVDPWTGIETPYDTQNIDHGEKATRPDPDPNEKEGHTFCGWLDGTTPYDFDTTITGPKTLTACYEKINVDVYFMNGTDLWQKKTIAYADTVTTADTNPTEEHKIFAYWAEENQGPFDFDNTQIKRDTYLYSVFEDITPPTITHEPLYWTNDKVLVTISHTNTNLSFKYKVDDGTYTDYTAPFELSTNSTIVAKSVYGDAESVITTHEVANIDKLNPTIDSATAPEVTKNSVTIAGTMSDAQSGVKTINIIRDNAVVASASGDAVNLELRDYTKSKDYSIIVAGLTSNTQYTFTVQVIDGAGNHSEAEVTATTEREEPVCRIISNDGVDRPQDAWVEFPLLELAVNDPLCVSKCTIQMIKGTTESVTILNTQDITLDLNGKTVSGVLPGYTINNQGEFTLVDDADEPGALKNTNNGGIAVLNNNGAKFTMGRGSSDAPIGSETRMVSLTTPYVFGEANGIYSENGAEFSFFDGKVKGTNAVQGEVTETEYLYNAISNTPDEYEEVTLAILDDPEARLNKSKYYSNIADAVRDAKVGTSEVEDTPDTFLSGFTHTTTKTSGYDTDTGYTFIYDAENDTLTSSNDIYGSKAFTETIIDLTDYTDDQILDILYRVDNDQPNIGEYSEDFYVEFKVTELDDNFNTETEMNWLTKTASSISYQLPKGKKYKVRIAYTQPLKLISGTYTPNGGGYEVTAPDDVSQTKLVITSVTLKKEEKEQFEHVIQQNAMTLHGFYYDETTDTYRSSNQYGDDYSKGTAASYVEIDLSGKEGNYTLYIDASIEGYNESRGIAMITNSPYYPSSSYYQSSSTVWGISLYNWSNRGYEEDAAMFGYNPNYHKVGPANGSTTLSGGSKYYLWFLYNKSAWGNGYDYYSQEAFEANGVADQFIINSLKIVKTGNSEAIDIPTQMKGNAFETDHLVDYDGGTYGLTGVAADGYYDSYIKVDLTNSDKDKIFEINPGYSQYNYAAVYITNNNRGLTREEILNNRYDMLMFKNDWNNSPYPYINGNSYYNYGLVKGYLLEKGNVYYIHFNTFLGYSWTRYDYKNAEHPEFDCYDERGYCGIRLKGISLIDVEDTALNFGKYKVKTGTVDVDGLAEETSTINLNNTDSISAVTRSVSSYAYNSETDRYELQQPIMQNGVSDFLTKIDLTGETEAQLYYYGSDYPNSYNNYYHLYTVDEPLVLHPYGDGGLTCSPNCNYTTVDNNTYFTLAPGHVYYFRRSVSTSTYSDIVTSDWFTLSHVGGVKHKDYTKAENVVSFNENVDEIQILKDIQLQNSMEVAPNKETVLDLNGYTLTSSLSTPIIKNYGKLTVIDSDYENQTSENKTHNGILESSNGTVIENEETATLIMKNFRLNNAAASSSNYGIHNKGNLTFQSGYDSKIYVTAKDATGIFNDTTGIIHESDSGLEVVMAYTGNKRFNSYYSYLTTSKLNTGITNWGYMNISGLKISGKNGTGLNNGSTAVLRNANINVSYEQADIDLDYKYTEYRTGYYGGYYYYDIEDRSVINSSYNDNGTHRYPLLTLKDSTVGMRFKNLSEEATVYMMSGSYVQYLQNNGQLLVKTNGTFAESLVNESYGNTTVEPATPDGTVSVQTVIDNYGSPYGSSKNRGFLKLFNFENMNSDFVINNYDSGKVESYDSNFYQIKNNGYGILELVNGTTKHISNEGSDVTLNSFTVDNEGTSFNEAILNSSTLNLEYNVNVIDHNKYAIYMSPYKSYDSFSDDDVYRQTVLNIGTDLEHQDSVIIQGSQYGVTGPCYYYQKNDITKTYDPYSIALEKRKTGDYYNADEMFQTEIVKQEEYDQTFCLVNFYSGQIKGSNDYEKLLDIPVFETAEGNNAHIGFEGLKVTSNTNINNYEASLTDKNYVAQIGSTKFFSIQEAVDSVTTNEPVTIDVINNSISIREINIPEGRNITINYTNGTNAYSYANVGYKNNGTLNITGTGKVNVASKFVCDNNSTLNVSNVYFDNIAKLFPRESALVNNKADVTVNNGTYNNIDIFNVKNATINGGTFNGTMFYGIGEESNTIVKPNIIGEGNVPTYLEFYDDNNNRLKNKYRHIFHLVDGATAKLEDYDTGNNSEYTHTRPLAYVKNANLELKNSTIGAPTDDNYNPVYIYATEKSNVTFNGGNYEQLYMINHGSNLLVNSGTLKNYSKGSTKYNLIYITGINPNTVIKGGTLSSNGNAIGLSQYDSEDWRDPSYNLIIGTKSDVDEHNEVICSKTDPVIIGDSYGIVSYGSVSGEGFFGFYDGIIKSMNNAIDVEIDEIEPDYEIITEAQPPYSQVKYLDQQDLVKNNTTGEIYKSFQKAFNEATNGDQLVTLRDFTNTTQSPKIIIPETSNFTLDIKHHITINNPEFIENNGTAVFNGIITEGSEPGLYTNYGNINANAGGIPFTNNGTLTVNGLEIISIKAGGYVFVNNANATLNILGADITTLQSSIVDNRGTLNINKTGSDSCYNTSRFHINYMKDTQCDNYNTPIVNSGTANIDYMTLKSDNYCRLIENSKNGTVTINHSTLDQSSYIEDDYIELDTDYVHEADFTLIKTLGNLTINNSTLIVVPKTVIVPDGGLNYWKDYGPKYVELDYIGTGSGDYDIATSNQTITLNNVTAETSIYGLIHINNGTPIINVSNTDLHSHSFGIMYDGKATMTLDNNTFNTYDASIEFNRYTESYTTTNYWNIYPLAYMKPDAAAKESVITINGGSYTSNMNLGNFEYKTYYPSSGISYSTMCTNGTMDSVELDSTTQRSYDTGTQPTYYYNKLPYLEQHTNVITSAGTLNINNATITGNNYDDHYYDGLERSYVYCATVGENPNEAGHTCTITDTEDEMAAITAFGTTNLVNTTVDTSNGYEVTAIKLRDDGVLNIGTKDGNYSNASPLVKSLNTNPIQGGVVKFYDGIIESVTTTAKIANMTNIYEVEDNYSLTKDETYKKIYLIPDPVVENLDQDKTYVSVQEAFDEAVNGDRLKFLKSVIALTDNEIVTVDNKTLSIDLNGKTVSYKLYLQNGSNLTVNANATGDNFIRVIRVDDTSELTLNAGCGTIWAYNNVTMTGDSKYTIYGYDNSDVTVSSINTSGPIYTNSGTSGYIYMSGNGKLTVIDSNLPRVDLANTSTLTTQCSTDANCVINTLNHSANNTISGGTYNTINNSSHGILNLTGGVIYIVNNEGTLTANGVTIENKLINTSNSNTTLTNCTITRNWIENRNSSVLTINGGLIDGVDNYNSGHVIINDGNVLNIDNNAGTVDFLGGSMESYPGQYSYHYTGITNDGYGTITIGTKDGNVSTTIPHIEGAPGDSNPLIDNRKGTINFYDGIVIGLKDVSLISGLINDIEPDYNLFETSYSETQTSIYLSPITHNDSAVASVNGIYYSSLQEAINKSVMNCTQGNTCPTVYITHNIELDADLTITDGYSVNIVSGGYTISTNNFNVPAAITLDGQPIGDPNNGGDIVNGIRGMLGLDKNTKDVLIYEMSDGSKLDTESHYRLYEYNGSEYELVTMEKGDEVARYNPGKGLTNMKPIKGRLYLTDLEPGSYKVSDDNGSEVTFTISDDGTLNGHVKEYIPSKNNIEATGEAKLLISIQTGIRKVNYMLIAISLILVLSVMFVIRKRSENNKNLV